MGEGWGEGNTLMPKKIVVYSQYFLSLFDYSNKIKHNFKIKHRNSLVDKRVTNFFCGQRLCVILMM